MHCCHILLFTSNVNIDNYNSVESFFLFLILDYLRRMSSCIVLGYFYYRYIMKFGLIRFEVRCEVAHGSKYEIVCCFRTILKEKKAKKTLMDWIAMIQRAISLLLAACITLDVCKLRYTGEGIYILLRFFSFHIQHSPWDGWCFVF